MTTPGTPPTGDPALNYSAELRKYIEDSYQRWQVRYDAQQAARRRLTDRYGTQDEKRWIADENGPQVDAGSLLSAVLHKSFVDRHPHLAVRGDAAVDAPALEHEDGLAAVHMIAAARTDAERREGNVMRQAVGLGVSWEEIAEALDTTVDDLRQALRDRGEMIDSWPTPDQPG